MNRLAAALRLTLTGTALLAGLAQAAPLPPDAPVPLPLPRPALLGAEMQGPPMPPRARPTPAAPPVTVTPAPAAPATPPAPAAAVDETSCPARLKAAGLVFEATAIGPQPEAACVVEDPVKLSGLDPENGLPVDFPDRPTLACGTALVFADYLRVLLLPYARGLFGSAVAAVGTGPGLECRTRDHIPGAKISAHGQGLAIDVAEIMLANGRRLDIGHPRDDAERSFDRGARAAACGFFHTALGPGADSFHESHWHFDLLPRGKSGDLRICQ